MPLRVGSLFAGIGGIDLGLQRAGMTVAWQCEKDDYCKQILNRHWPHTPVYDDVRALYRSPRRDSAYPEKPDVLAGGFPCQDISLAGTGGGLDSERSGLWWEFDRLIGLLRPRYVVVENVPALVRRGLDAICGRLAAHGYDAEWQIVSAAAMGAPHIRERIFVVAYPSGVGRDRPRSARRCLRDRDGDGQSTVRRRSQQQSRASGDGERPGEVADASGTRRQEQHASALAAESGYASGRDDPADMADPAGQRRDAPRRTSEAVFGPGAVERLTRCRRSRGAEKWATEPNVDRLADGIPDRVDRTRALGNAVVPQVAEFVGRCIIDHHKRTP